MRKHAIERRLALGLLSALTALCQVPPQGPASHREFEVASVRLANPPDAQHPRTRMGGPAHKDPEHLTIRRLSLPQVVSEAFDATRFGKLRLSAPNWADSIILDIDAKIPPGTAIEQFHVMLQNLFVERFHLKYHLEKRAIPTYSLVIAKGGLKMKASANQETDGAEQFRLDRDGFPVLPAGMHEASFPANGQNSVTAHGVTMESVSRTVQAALGQGALVADKTGLTGVFDYHLRYAVPFTPAITGADPNPSEPAPDILTAIREQLGLAVEKGAGQIDLVVIDQIDRAPADN